jgi:signal transduction histidine kinase/ActR/RegA family two-component response regulator
MVQSRRITLPEPLDRLLDWFVPEGRDPYETRRRKIVVGFTLTILGWSPFYAAIYAFAFPQPYSTVAVGGLAVGMAMVAIVPLLVRRGAPTGFIVGMLGFALGGLLLLMCWMTGGYRSPLLAWMVLHPLLALGFGGIRLAWVWTATVFAQLALLAAARQLGVPAVDLLSETERELLWGVTLVTITLSAFFVGWMYEAIKNLTIAELEQANRAKSDFLAHMSHEIRTPMTAILGFAEMMLDEEKVAPDQAEHLRTIRRNGEHLLAVINDILDLSRVEAGRVELEWSAVRPALLVEEVAALIGPRARARGLDFEVEIDPALPLAIRSDATRLKQIVINLAANAVKFTERGRVRLAARAEANVFVLFEVTDTGPGIPRDRLERIFDAFAQGDASMSRRFGGTGLGLAISRQLALVLGGDLDVASELGRGSVFSLRVPNDPAHELAPARADARPAEPDRALRGRVLLAEDGADSRRLLVHLLERWGLEVEIAENGASAIELARRASERLRPFDLVLMDMQMPELDGYEATRRLRVSGFRGPVIALTAHAMAGARDACLAAGCDDYLTKPIDRARLRAALAEWLDRAANGTRA